MEETSQRPPVRIFICYSRQDGRHLQALTTHLAPLIRQKMIEAWDDRALEAGQTWEPELLEKLRAADVVLLLVSPDFMASDYIQDVELDETFNRHARGDVRVIPILVRPADVKDSPIDRLQGLPKDREPITKWSDADDAWLSVVRGLREVIARLPGKVAASASGVPDPFIPPAWRHELERRYGHLELLAGNRAPRRRRLDELYVDLHTDWRSELEGRAVALSLEKDLQSGNGPAGGPGVEMLGVDRLAGPLGRPLLSWLESAGRGGPRPLQVLLTHPEHRHFALRGAPGSGKSTFARAMALEHAIRGDAVLPLYLELKDFTTWLERTSTKGDEAAHLLSWAGHVLADFGLDRGALEARLGRGRTLWLLDGLDEIFDLPLRGRVAAILCRFVHGPLGRTERLLVMSRPHALDDAALRRTLGLEAATAGILPLDPDAQLTLLTRWFEALFEPHERVEAAEEARRLHAHLELHPHIAELRATPLLLVTMAQVYLSGRKLPERRAELFERAVEMLLERRFGPYAPGGSLERALRVRQALAYVARQMMELGAVRELGELEFRRLLDAGWCPETGGMARVLEVQRLAMELGSHTGLVELSGSPPVYRFSHLAFQEYLAAWTIGQEVSPIDAVAARLDEGAWRETILLTAGYLGMAGIRRLVTDFLEALKARQGEGAALCRRLELAVQGAVEAPRGVLPRELEQSLRHLAVAALEDVAQGCPVLDRVRLGLALGRLGDPRLGMEKPERWVLLPPWGFAMGSEEYAKAQPIRWVSFTREYWIGRYPVTNEEYRPFVEEGGYRERTWWDEEGWAMREREKIEEPSDWRHGAWNASNQPVVGVSWYEARAYCRWLTAWLEHRCPPWWPGGTDARLPTEAEWEYAARGPDGRRHPWGGEEPSPERANYDEAGIGLTSPVGVFPMGATPDGVQDLAGNAWEWCADWYGAYSQKDVARLVDPVGPAFGSHRVLRGGSWENGALCLRGSYRLNGWPSSRFKYIGFRVVLSAAEPEAPATGAG